MTEDTPFIWHELVTHDQRASGDFFGELFGWERKEVDAGRFGTYTLFQKHGQDVAGMMNPTVESSAMTPFWHAYFAVDDMDHYVARALALGGTIVVHPHEVPGVGIIGAVADPVGAVAHLMQPVP